jgi:uncharacterized protein (TIRG00374 family)
MHKRVTGLIGIIISVIFIVYIAREIETKNFYSTLKNVNGVYILSGVAAFIAGYFLKAYRWLLIVREHSKIFTAGNTFPPFFIGFASNNILPLRMGEVVRASLLSLNTQSSIVFSFSSIFLDRILDGLALLILILSASFILSLSDWVMNITYTASIVFILSFLLLLFVSFSTHLKLFRVTENSGKILRTIYTLLNNVRNSLKILRSPYKFLAVLLFSVIVWFFESTMYYSFASAMNLDVTFIESVIIMVILNFGILIPSAPAYIGTFEFFCIKSMQLFGIAESSALTYSVFLHTAQFISINILGIIYLNMSGLKWDQFRRLIQTGENKVDPV